MPKIKPLIIKEILKKHTITDYLAKKGYSPDTTDGYRSRYTCPLPDHEDATPSFWVFHDGEYEKYKCFGCSSWGDIINLHKNMEKKSIRETLFSLGEGIEISSNQEWDNLIEQIKDFRIDQQNHSIDHYNILISKIFEKEDTKDIDSWLSQSWDYTITNSYSRSTGVAGTVLIYWQQKVNRSAESIKEEEGRSNSQIKREEQELTFAKQHRVRCQRCGGAGGARHWPGYTCFECGGSGSVDPYQMTPGQRSNRGLPRNTEELDQYFANRIKQLGG